MISMQLPAPAKINWFLHVLGRRADGYHEIQTLFQFVDLHDDLHFFARKDGRINLNPELFGVADSDNLIVRAARALQAKTGCAMGADITLHKKIPMGAGLGGGSSNAATTLLALNRLWHTGLSLDELSAIGLTIGADVPVFLHGSAAWAEGIGERLTPIILPQPWLVLVIPNCHVPTAELYHDSRLTRDSNALTIQHYQIGQGQNDFASIVRQDYPAVDQALCWLSQHGDARMSGSGGVCFAAFDSSAEASKIASLVPRPLQAVVVKGMNHSPLHEALANSFHNGV